MDKNPVSESSSNESDPVPVLGLPEPRRSTRVPAPRQRFSVAPERRHFNFPRPGSSTPPTRGSQPTRARATSGRVNTSSRSTKGKAKATPTDTSRDHSSKQGVPASELDDLTSELSLISHNTEESPRLTTPVDQNTLTITNFNMSTTGSNNAGPSGNPAPGGNTNTGSSGSSSGTGGGTQVVGLFGDTLQLTKDELDEYNSKDLPKRSKVAPIFDKDEPSSLNSWIEDVERLLAGANVQSEKVKVGKALDWMTYGTREAYKGLSSVKNPNLKDFFHELRSIFSESVDNELGSRQELEAVIRRNFTLDLGNHQRIKIYN